MGEHEPRYIRLMEIKNRAKRLGIQVTIKMSREELIHGIQQKEGNRPCFNTDVINCQQMDCCWYCECQRH